MKFILVLHLCSILNQNCFESMHVGLSFDNHRSCAIAGYEISGASLKALDPETVNKEELAVKFECKKVPNKTIIPPPKPGQPT